MSLKPCRRVTNHKTRQGIKAPSSKSVSWQRFIQNFITPLCMGEPDGRRCDWGHCREPDFICPQKNQKFFWLVAAWVKSRAERPSVSGVNRQLHVQIGCKLGIRNRKDELTKQARWNELQINPKVIKGGERMQEKDEVITNASGRGYWVYTCNERPQGRFQ